MYYNANKNNSDYYNTYKQEMANLEEYDNGLSFQKILKLGFTILLLGLSSLLSIYVVNYFSTEKKEIKVERVVMEEALPKSIQLKESTKEKFVEVEAPRTIEKVADVSNQDIALIVEIIMSQMNHKKETLLENQLISSEKDSTKERTLKENNHYNKVLVATSKKQNIVDRQMRLREELNQLLQTPIQATSKYEREIQKEIDVRSNEMRIIVVQKGDTLSKIAKKAYGDINAYMKILTANPEVVKNPNEIFVGQKLRIPA